MKYHTPETYAMGLVLKYRYALAVLPEHAIFAAMLSTIETLDAIDIIAPESPGREMYQKALFYLDELHRKHAAKEVETITNPEI